MIKEVEFIFENLESVTFPSNVIGTLEIDDIGLRVARVACNAFERYMKAGDFAIEIFKEGDTQNAIYGKSWIWRIAKFHDITSVIVRYHGGKEDTFRLIYACENDDTDENLYQKNYVSDCGNLYIVVHPSKTIDDYFDIQRLDDEEHMHFMKGVFGIGEAETEEEQ